jgi:hypothetical protein
MSSIKFDFRKIGFKARVCRSLGDSTKNKPVGRLGSYLSNIEENYDGSK